MTTLESRVASLELDLAIVAEALQQIVINQTLFSSLASWQLQQLLAKVKRISDDLSEGDEWKDFG